MLTQEDAEKKSKRKNGRKCTGTLSKEEEIIQDCKDAEKAKTTSDTYNFTFKEKVVSAAKKQAELIREKYKDSGINEEDGESILDIELRKVCIKIRDRFTNKNHKSEVTHIITEVFGGKYTRKYTPKEQKLLRDGEMEEYAECTDLTEDLMESFRESNRLLNADVVPQVKKTSAEDDDEEYHYHDTPRDEIDDWTKDNRNAAVRWARRGNIPWLYEKQTVVPGTSKEETPADEEAPGDNNPNNNEKVSLEAAEAPPDKNSKHIKVLTNELKGLETDIGVLREDIEVRNFVSDNSDEIDGYTLGVQALRQLIKPAKQKRQREDIIREADMLEKWLDRQHDNTSAEHHTRKIKYRPNLPPLNEPYTVPSEGAAVRSINKANFIVTNFRFALAMLRNYRRKKYPQKVKKKRKMHPILEQSAFGANR